MWIRFQRVSEPPVILTNSERRCSCSCLPRVTLTYNGPVGLLASTSWFQGLLAVLTMMALDSTALTAAKLLLDVFARADPVAPALRAELAAARRAAAR